MAKAKTASKPIKVKKSTNQTSKSSDATKSLASEILEKNSEKVSFLESTDDTTTSSMDTTTPVIDVNPALALKEEYIPKHSTASNTASFQWWLDLVVNENWAYIHNAFSPEECEKIIRIGTSRDEDQATNLSYGTVGGDGDRPTSLEDTVKVRRSPVSWIRADVETNRWIFERLTNHVVGINKQFFNYDLTDIQSVQFTCYDGTEGGFYGKHIDMMYKGTGTRKLSVSVQLSDPSTYEGGDILLHTRVPAEQPFRNQGTAIFFPSWTLHEVTPVTKGKRYSLVAWIQGPRFK